MTDRLTQLIDRFRTAEAAVDASRTKLRKRSAERLAELLNLPPSERLRSLGDSALTLFDRDQLERSIEAELPLYRPRHVETLIFDTTKVRRLLRYHRRLILRGAVALAPIVYFSTRAVLATPAQAVPVTVKTPLHVNWSMPDGYHEVQDISVDSEEIWVRLNGEGHLRRWIPGRGYALSPVIPESYWTDGDIKAR